MKLSIIIPTLNEARSLGATLDAVNRLQPSAYEVVIVDGGSRDATLDIARTHASRNSGNITTVRVIESERGRGAQLHAGACAARGDAFWFLHADTCPPIDAMKHITEALRDAGAVGGNFTISFDGVRLAARFMTSLYPRLRRIGLCYGDSAFFVRREAYEHVGGFQPFPIFEDLDLLRRLRRRGKFVHLKSAVTTSSRRFEGKSFALTFTRWSLLQAMYWAGVHPRTLEKLYAPVRAAQGNKSGKQEII
ncbi:MAG: TIGR04283 family arsenosugar biosynthesis glycosyltransferase [Pyrinomonadaceae bacterium]